jgi:hypothetical protein
MVTVKVSPPWGFQIVSSSSQHAGLSELINAAAELNMIGDPS